MTLKMNFYLVIIFIIGFSIEDTHTAELRLYKNSVDEYTVAPLDDPELLLSDPDFNPNLTTLFYTFGFTGSATGPFTQAVLNTYLKYEEVNVVLLDWQKEAQIGYLGISVVGYTLSAVPNAKRVGDALGEALLHLEEAGLDMEKIRLMGHSLGAHVMGFAGKRTKSQGKAVARITGLDPAGPLFDGPSLTNIGLDHTCAVTVDIIHTNSGNYGTVKSRGTVDFWPNYSLDGIQPGCSTGKLNIGLSEADLCSHNRAVLYMIESVRSKKAFPATGAENYISWLAIQPPSNDTAYMGDDTDPKARGNYYLRTNAQEPFSKGPEGAFADQSRN